MAVERPFTLIGIVNVMTVMSIVAIRQKAQDCRYGGHFVLISGVWWATLDSNQ